MPKIIPIRGTIIGPLPKNSWARDYVEAGLVTPQNDVIDAVKSATDDIVLEINSPGGSVFSGNEMLNAIVDWQKTTGKKVDVKVGAMAASQAASIVLQATGKKTAHKNAKFMFHSASSWNEGGPESMTDMATLLSQINADTTKKLDALGVPKEVYSEWMAEGRMGWVTAEQAKQYGIVDEVIGEEAAVGKLPKAFVKAATAALPGLSIVALGLEEEPEQETTTDEPAAAAATDDKSDSDKIAMEFKETVANLGAKVASLTGEKAELEKSLATAKADVEKLTAELNASKAEAENIRSMLAKEVTAHASTTQQFEELRTIHARAVPVANPTESGAAGIAGNSEHRPTGNKDADRRTWGDLVAKHGFTAACRMAPELRKSIIN